MTLYSKCRLFSTVWCSLEILFFAGIIYGWSSLVFIFTDEGFYNEYCEKQSIFIVENRTTTDVIVPLENNRNLTGFHSKKFLDKYKGRCGEQESRLGLWFSIGVGCTWAGMAILGPLSKAVGTRVTRIVILFVYEVGLFCLAFTSTETTWLICPGLCCIGVAGLALFASNIQVSNLFETYSSTVVALFCGLFDSSSVVMQSVKIAYSYGIGRKESFLFLACLHLVMVGTSTFFILPKYYITGETTGEQEVHIYVESGEDERCKEVQQKPVKQSSHNIEQKGLMSYVASTTYVTHVTWMTVHCLLFASFLNLLYIRIDKLAHGEEHVVSYYLGVFAYTTMASFVGSVIAGLVYDFERKRRSDSKYPENKWKPVIIPMIVCGVFITTVFCSMLVENISFLFPSFILFTLYRNFLFSIGIAFLNEAFPPRYFGPLYGFMTLTNGLFSLLQYGFVKWTVSSSDGYQQVHVVLLVLAAGTFLHPFQLWIRSNQIKRQNCNMNYEESFPLQEANLT